MCCSASRLTPTAPHVNRNRGTSVQNQIDTTLPVHVWGPPTRGGVEAGRGIMLGPPTEGGVPGYVAFTYYIDKNSSLFLLRVLSTRYTEHSSSPAA